MIRFVVPEIEDVRPKQLDPKVCSPTLHIQHSNAALNQVSQGLVVGPLTLHGSGFLLGSVTLQTRESKYLGIEINELDLVEVSCTSSCPGSSVDIPLRSVRP